MEEKKSEVAPQQGQEKKAETAKPPPEAPKSLSEALQIAQIALDTYDDLFSDFDPSPFETRILSDDFLRELKRRYAERGKGEFVINFTLPKATRSYKTESLIKKRIRDYFKTKLKTVDKARKEGMNNGLLRFTAGLAISLGILIVPELETVPLVTLLSVLTWFLLWTGYDNLLAASQKLRKKKSFYEKFLKADYRFVDEEEVVKYLSSSYR